MNSFDVIVIGAGVIGSCTAYQLAKLDVKTLMIEQFPLPHTRGSSCGQTRMTQRSDRNPYRSDLVPESIAFWKSLEKDYGTPLLIKTGHLGISVSEESNYALEPIKVHMRKSNVDYTEMRGQDIGNSFPGLDFDSQFGAYYVPNGFILKATKCLHALQSGFVKHGGTLQENEKVIEVKHLSANSVSMRTDSHKVYYAKSVVLACGPWINKVLRPLDIELDLQSVRVTTYYWREKELGKYSIHNNFPTIVLYFGVFHVYSTPSYEYPGLIKICYHYRAPVDPDAPDLLDMESEKAEVEQLETLKQIISKHFPQLESVPVLSENALQTVTPTSDFIIDKLPGFPNIVIGAGFSGTGFGPAPAIGRALSKLATFQDPGQDMKTFALGSRLIYTKSSL
uniref:peroxisomal sarcosine oxidase-like isoform X1 n=1 Tax=Ciona intestinalis TaxID=7719 RepID=UPI000180D341|nr:peroxisomal sarcosine oxidase-like isoform X1 [Ciona intestinalis]XP_026689862.1 peroxisomal sarcosine oxidase-like isoform X1 [Ciona intestinalis]|eukprot:XP_002124441.3 peroxisomal sarcosine oxidase-like isoform X1 [Ciona intestinalis]